MSRQRLTWGDRKASAHPATPDEGPASPAHKPDPGASDYENGDTSSWAEDVHPGPYPNSAHPATPDEGPASPAYKAAAIERRAAKCIRIATHMLGDPSGDPTKVAAIEDQALGLMNLSDREIHASLKRLGEDVEIEEEVDEEGSKKASVSKAAAAKITSNAKRIARLERILIRLAEDEEGDEEASDEDSGDDEEEEVVEVDEEGSKKANYMEDDLQSMLAEEGMLDDEFMDDEDAAFDGMLAEEGMLDEIIEEDAEFMDDDPMGVLDGSMDDDEMMVLAALHPEMARKAGDDDEEEEVVVVEEEASKKASSKPRPQARKASAGAQRLGGVNKQAASEINELSALWETAPDVSSHF